MCILIKYNWSLLFIVKTLQYSGVIFLMHLSMLAPVGVGDGDRRGAFDNKSFFSFPILGIKMLVKCYQIASAKRAVLTSV